MLHFISVMSMNVVYMRFCNCAYLAIMVKVDLCVVRTNITKCTVFPTTSKEKKDDVDNVGPILMTRPVPIFVIQTIVCANKQFQIASQWLVQVNFCTQICQYKVSASTKPV